MSIRKSSSSWQDQRQLAENDLPDLHRRETQRQRFRPACLRFLFIGESPPASGKFFYYANSGLYRAMRDAFHFVDPSINDENFLEAFQSSGCYLVDLCPEPVDLLNPKSRRDVCRANETLLSQKIAQLQPQMIASVLRSIEGNIVRAASRAEWRGPLINLPYPGRWSRHRNAFLDSLVPVLSAGAELSLKNHFKRDCQETFQRP